MSCSGCQDKLKLSDVEKWTNDLNQMMANEIGREKFIKFLEDRDLDDSLTTVSFIIDCDSVLEHLKEDGRRRHNRFRRNIHGKLSDLVKAAEDVNFYENEIEKLREILEEEDNTKVSDIVRRAKSKAFTLLDQEHKEFSKYLIKEYHSTCK